MAIRRRSQGNPNDTGSDFPPLSVRGLFAGMVLLLEIERRFDRRCQVKDDAGARDGLGQVEGAVLALMDLSMAFMFSGGAARCDGRRQSILPEAIAIGTAWSRLDLQPVPAQPELRSCSV